MHVGIMSSNSDAAFPSHFGIADIDECANNNGGCDHDCINNPGSHICQCDPGYELHVNLKMCLRELTDEICTLLYKSKLEELHILKSALGIFVQLHTLVTVDCYLCESWHHESREQTVSVAPQSLNNSRLSIRRVRC